MCNVCNHLNGEYEDSEDFANKIYLSDYEENYYEEDTESFNKRLKHIYQPKSEFLIESLENYIKLNEINVLDVGAGSGYFVMALETNGISAKGIEISKKQVDYANKMFKTLRKAKNSKKKKGNRNEINHCESKLIKEYIKNTESNVLSFIGVLEHITNLDEILQAVKKNKNIEYIFLSLPLFSLSCILESANNYFNRQLGGSHTHLFTLESLEYLSNFLGFEIVSKWQFGQNIVDLYRFILLDLEKNNNLQLKNYFINKFAPIIDELQLTIDKNDFGCEIHVLLKRKA